MNDPDSTPRQTLTKSVNSLAVAQIGLFTLACIYTIYIARPVLLPLILGVLITLVVKPIHRRLCKWLRLPAPLSALVVMLSLVGLVILAVSQLAVPAGQYMEEIREESVEKRLRDLFEPVSDFHDSVTKVAEDMTNLADSADEALTGDEEEKDSAAVNVIVDAASALGISKKEEEPIAKVEPPVRVEISESKETINAIYSLLQEISVHLLVTLALVFFFLGFGDTMIKRVTEVDGADEWLDEVTTEVSFYLFTITAINIGLGACIGLALAALGVPNPLLWGVMAGTLNFIPYIGSLIGTGIVLLVSAMTFDTTTALILPPIAYYTLTSIEGNFITPMIIGKRFTLNPIIVFVWVLCWGAFWGVAGMLIGLPLLMVFRIVCHRMPSFARVERVISS